MNTTTANGAVAFHWDNPEDYNKFGRAQLCDLFNMSRDATKEEVIAKLPVVWNYNQATDYSGTWVIALMFYMRNIRKSKYETEQNKALVRMP